MSEPVGAEKVCEKFDIQVFINVCRQYPNLFNQKSPEFFTFIGHVQELITQKETRQ